MPPTLALGFQMSDADTKTRAGRNRTLTLTESDRELLRPNLLDAAASEELRAPYAVTINGDYAAAIARVPDQSVDLLILDPPYNLNKSFNGRKFAKRTVTEYTEWLNGVVSSLLRVLKPTATVYVCGDWLSSASIFDVCTNHFTVRNRITWEREKGRGANWNWKNCSEDIWFCTVSDTYTFNVEAVKLRRKVIAPYRNDDGSPKDWREDMGGNFRDTHPSNLWTDISIPFWSMPENTDHPTQKSEKLIAKLVLASSNANDVVLDPFLGSGTSSVVSKKLGRQYIGIEIDEEFCLLAEKRLSDASTKTGIQGFSDGVFWERNTLNLQGKASGVNGLAPHSRTLFSNAKDGDDGEHSQ